MYQRASRDLQVFIIPAVFRCRIVDALTCEISLKVSDVFVLDLALAVTVLQLLCHAGVGGDERVPANDVTSQQNIFLSMNG